MHREGACIAGFQAPDEGLVDLGDRHMSCRKHDPIINNTLAQMPKLAQIGVGFLVAG